MQGPHLTSTHGIIWTKTRVFILTCTATLSWKSKGKIASLGFEITARNQKSSRHPATRHYNFCRTHFTVYNILLFFPVILRNFDMQRNKRVQINISYMQSVAGKWVQVQVYPYGSYYVSEHQQPPPVIVNIALVKESFYWYMSLQTIFKEHMYHTIMYIFCEVFKKLFEISAWNLANNVSMPGSRFCIKLGHR